MESPAIHSELSLDPVSLDLFGADDLPAVYEGLAPPPPEPSTLEELLVIFREARPKDDVTIIEKAYAFAERCHTGQLRASGEPYILHPLAVACILAGMRMDAVSVVTGLLHDVVEDTSATSAEVQKAFGDEIARCVDGVTKLSKIEFSSAEERQAENYRKMLLAMVNDIRVIIVKLADRLHNMRTLGALSPERRERIAKETLEIFAPIAHRLGMGKVRGELEDLAFRHRDSEAFAEVSRTIDAQQAANERYIDDMRKTVEEELRREGIPARVEGRVKRAFSVYQKLIRQKISLDQVYDILAIRIITDSVKNCYGALGVIHHQWRPVPGRIKDFIAMPRPNLYQSLHTSVVGLEGKHCEIQIRTEEMHRIAEEGIAAHWKYKEGTRGAQDDQRIAWLRQLVEWQRDMQDSTDFTSTLKLDLFPEEVYCFTPKGRVIVLPAGSSPIDFAYAVHSEVGNTCVGARINARIVPLRSTLHNGDVVDIITQPGHQPGKDWLGFAKTSRARNKIKHVINTNERERAIEIGEKFLEKEARRLAVSLSRIPKAAFEAVAAEYGMSKLEDLHAALGYGKFSARQVLQKCVPDQVPDATPSPVVHENPQSPARTSAAADDAVIRVTGIDDVMVYRAKCCNPIKGDSIVGYVTRGKGIAVHSRACSNVQNLMYESERRIDVEWERAATESFAVHLVVKTDDRPGLLHQITSILHNENSNVRSLEARTDYSSSGDSASVEMTIDVRDKKQLEKLCGAIRRISGVRDVERTHT